MKKPVFLTLVGFAIVALFAIAPVRISRTVAADVKAQADVWNATRNNNIVVQLTGPTRSGPVLCLWPGEHRTYNWYELIHVAISVLPPKTCSAYISNANELDSFQVQPENERVVVKIKVTGQDDKFNFATSESPLK